MANVLPLKIVNGQLAQFATGDTIAPAVAPGSGGSLSLTIVEASLGATPNARRSGSFTITSTGMTAGKPVIIRQIEGPYTGKGTRGDEAEMDSINAAGQVLNATTIQCRWESLHRVRGNYKFAYLIGA
jgi:hypothetical protein